MVQDTTQDTTLDFNVKCAIPSELEQHLLFSTSSILNSFRVPASCAVRCPQCSLSRTRSRSGIPDGDVMGVRLCPGQHSYP